MTDPRVDVLGSGPAAAAGIVSASAGRRAEVAVVGGLIALAGLAWVETVRRMTGMDGGPGADPGPFGSFLSTWIVMMTAMMLPAIATAVARIAAGAVRIVAVTRVAVLLIAAYLAIWTVVGVVGYAALRWGRALGGGFFAWDRAGRGVVIVVLLVAAVYQLTGAKRESLRHCRRPVRPENGFALRTGPVLREGLALGAWCVSCSWALMASLFALGAMSVHWMVLIAALVAAERILPRPAAVRMVGAGLVAALAIGIALEPSHVPGLTIPGSGPAMHDM